MSQEVDLHPAVPYTAVPYSAALYLSPFFVLLILLPLLMNLFNSLLLVSRSVCLSDPHVRSRSPSLPTQLTKSRLIIQLCFLRYLTMLLLERQKLAPFVEVLPNCSRLLQQGMSDHCWLSSQARALVLRSHQSVRGLFNLPGVPPSCPKWGASNPSRTRSRMKFSRVDLGARKVRIQVLGAMDSELEHSSSEADGR